MIRINIEPPSPIDAFSLEDIPASRNPGIGVTMVAFRPRCSVDGALMDVSIHNGQASIDEGPFPVYDFECPICGTEDEIS